MKPSTRNRAKGTGRQIKGGIKEAAGKVGRSTRLKVGGKIEKNAGRLQRRFGEAQRDTERDLERSRRRARA